LKHRISLFSARVVLAIAAFLARPAMAEPHYYSITIKERADQFSRAPEAIDVNSGSWFLRNSERSILTYADIETHYAKAAEISTDLASATDFAAASTLIFLTDWAATPSQVALNPRHGIELFAQTVPIEHLKILPSNAASDKNPDIGPLSRHFADADWTWTQSQLEIRSDDYEVFLNPLAWLKDRRDGQDKMLITLIENVPTGTYQTTLPLLLTFGSDRVVEAEYVPDFLYAIHERP